MLESIQRIDEQLLCWISENLRNALLDKIMIAYTTLGNAGAIFIILSFVLLLKRSTRNAGIGALSAMLLGLLFANLIFKPLVARPRPWVIMENFIPLIYSSDLNSFPSGHTCAAFAFAVAVSCLIQRKGYRAAALTAAALMGFSRLYVGVHFLSDIIAGVLIGSACGWLMSYLLPVLIDLYHNPRVEG